VRLSKVFLIAALGVSAFAGAAAAGRPPLQDGALSVRDGRANIMLKMKGSTIGRIGNGRLVVTDSPAGATIVVRGAGREHPVNGNTTVYSGTNIRFRVADDRRFSLKIAGKGLNFSAVGRGDGWIDGWGDPAGGVFFDGSYSLNGEPYRSLPDERTRFDLAAPPTR